MITILLSVVIFAVLVGAMAVGVIMGNKPIAGSCGGLNTIGMKEDCDICGGNDTLCDEEKQRKKKAAKQDVLAVGGTLQPLFNDATKK
jgi:hypothetical protein